MLLHKDHVGDAERERAAGAPLADDARNYGRPEPRHQLEIGRNRLGLAAFLCAHARFGALRIDKRDKRNTEAVRDFEDARRLAIALGMRFAEVAPEPLRSRPAALMAHDRDRPMSEKAEPGHDCAVVREAPVTMNLEEFGDERVDVVERLRPRGMAREPDAIHRAESEIELILYASPFGVERAAF